MNRFKITIDILQYWHCGSGSGGEGDVDATPQVEPCGLPFLPGKHLKGLLREAARFAIANGYTGDDSLLGRWFGSREADVCAPCEAGLLHVSNGLASGAFADHARRHFEKCRRPCPEIPALFETLRQTALEGGVAREHTLRSVRCSVPMTLEAVVEIDEDGGESLSLLCSLVRSLGHARNDGLGRCRLRAEALPEAAPKSDKSAEGKECAFVELTLVDDVILSASGGSAGGHRCLDHVPGSALLGIAAAHVYRDLKQQERALRVFHEGAVRFGPAYPVLDGRESLPVPASWHVPKDDRGGAPRCLAGDPEALAGAQPVQMRSGFLEGGTTISPVTGHRQKTAIDPESGTAEEAKLFGFSFLPKGMRFVARVEADDSADLAAVLGAFNGREVRLGRSRRTEFGRAKAQVVSAIEGPELPAAATSFLVHAESDLCVVSKEGHPTTDPSSIIRALGLPEDDDWHIDKERTFLRTRRYSPWNGYRGSFDPERVVIRAGSVLACVGSSEFKPEVDRIGLSASEGLGRIRWELPAAPAKLEQSDGLPPVEEVEPASCPESLVLHRFRRQQIEGAVASLAKTWEADWKKFRASLSASQWSRLREAATLAASAAELASQLDDKTSGMFHHGRMAGKWRKELGRGRKLSDDILNKLRDSGRADDLRLAACREAARLVAADRASVSR